MHEGAILLHWDLLQHKSNNAGVKSPHIHDEPVHYLKAETNKEHERKLRLHTPERSEHNNNINSVWFAARWVKTSFRKSQILWFHHSVLALPRFQKSRQEWIQLQETAEICLCLKDCPISWRKETDFNSEPPFRQISFKEWFN